MNSNRNGSNVSARNEKKSSLASDRICLKIENWEVNSKHDAVKLIHFISGVWIPPGKISIDEKAWGYRFFFNDGGVSQNREFSNALENNIQFWNGYWCESKVMGILGEDRVVRHKFYIVLTDKEPA